MRVENNKKQILYHIQSTSDIYSDGLPYDLFAWSIYSPTSEQVKELYIKDRFDNNDSINIDEAEVEDFMESYNVYTIYSREVE